MARPACRVLSTVFIAALWVLCVARAARATDPPTPTPTPGTNIVLIILDDLSWADLPFFSPPIDWKDGTPPPFTPKPAREYRLIRPELNRLAARMLADRTNGSLGKFGREPLSPDVTPTRYPVIPQDASASHAYSTAPPMTPGSCGTPTCTPASCADPKCICGPKDNDCNCCVFSRDVLEGFGGLNRLATEGVKFTNFYATTALCAPSRASILTGRHPRRTGVLDNNHTLPSHEITIAEYLKQNCPTPNGETRCFSTTPGACSDGNPPCYTTGLIGKWHLGSKA